ncbi:MAG: DNA primase DnaG [Candidatus ainarchaeum sp.]|nr:DNA primase DnaG [Candidatus ainarchaeum sp.]
MAKTYLSTVKYEIKASYEITGIVDKPDIIGAIFGQSEGLLGQDMDLKELQQNGKLGRIEISVKKGKGKTNGEIIIPSSLDKVKTSILAATIETVNKVGPCDAVIKILGIEDTRQEKRSVITDRAKELLKSMQANDESTESIEIAEEIKSDIRTEKIVKYKGLAAGPEVEMSEEIILVEGRADVLKLLSYGIKNAIEMNGSNISPALIELCKVKNVTVLVDGDRGGELNIKKLASLTKIDFVAKAPDGKEVEELTQKEILLSLKRKVPFAESIRNNSNQVEQTNNFNQNQGNGYRNNNFVQRPFNPHNNFGNRPNFNNNGGFNNNFNNRNNFQDRNNFGNRPNFNNNRNGQNFQGNGFRNNNFVQRPNFNNNRDGQNFQGNGFRNNNFGNRPNFNSRPGFNQRPSFGQPNFRSDAPVEFDQNPRFENQNIVREERNEVVTPKEILNLKKDFDKLKGKGKARLLDEKYKKIKDVGVKEMVDTIAKSKKKVHVIMYDGVISKKVIDTAEEKNIPYIVAVKKAKVSSTKVKLITM